MLRFEREIRGERSLRQLELGGPGTAPRWPCTAWRGVLDQPTHGSRLDRDRLDIAKARRRDRERAATADRDDELLAAAVGTHHREGERDGLGQRLAGYAGKPGRDPRLAHGPPQLELADAQRAPALGSLAELAHQARAARLILCRAFTSPSSHDAPE